MQSSSVTWLGIDFARPLISLVKTMASLESHGPMVRMAEVNPAIYEEGHLWLVDVRWQAQTAKQGGAGL
jgi:hypothetical protein